MEDVRTKLEVTAVHVCQASQERTVKKIQMQHLNNFEYSLFLLEYMYIIIVFSCKFMPYTAATTWNRITPYCCMFSEDILHSLAVVLSFSFCIPHLLYSLDWLDLFYGKEIFWKYCRKRLENPISKVLSNSIVLKCCRWYGNQSRNTLVIFWK